MEHPHDHPACLLVLLVDSAKSVSVYSIVASLAVTKPKYLDQAYNILLLIINN